MSFPGPGRRSTRGGAVAVALIATAIACAPAAQAEFGLQPGEQAVALSTLQAGDHPDLTASFKMNLKADGFPDGGTLKDIAVAMPPGFGGSAIATPTCTEAQLTLLECPQAAQVGEFTTKFLEFGVPIEATEPVYNLEPAPDAVAEFGIKIVLFNVVVKVSVRANDYGLTAESRDNPDLFPVLLGSMKLWGVPADHNGSGGARRALLTNPFVCGTASTVRFSVDSWQAQGHFVDDFVGLTPFVGCAKLPPLTPKLSATPSVHRAGQPSGYDIDLEVPQVDNPDGIDTPPVKAVTMELPRGVRISPSAADGLQACSDAQADFGSSAPVACPDGSKVGSLSIETPALADPIGGALYVGEPKREDRYRLILVAEGPGVTVKLPGSVRADPDTGQLTTTFADTPQLPFSAVRVKLKGGPRALLANPSSCGTYETEATLIPYGGGPAATASGAFGIDDDCANGGFHPALDAGAVDPVAGAFSPFVFELNRDDHEQNVAALDVSLPNGELAKLAGVPLCPDALAASGSCPSATQVGRVTVAAGSGAQPLWVPQPGKEPTAVYLAGPYEGAPYSIVAKVPAQAGPYDLGVVAVRSAIHVDPETAEVTVASDPLPQILEGIPIEYRIIHVDADRPGFALNPTDCEPMSVGASVRSDANATAKVSSRFQVRDCARLGFKPRLSLRLFGKAGRGAHPRLQAVLKMPPGGANIARASVALPHSEFLDQAHIRTICTRVQFAADSCPAASVYGHATAKTPLLDEPLRGPVYLRSSNHELPDLVADLRGQIHVVLSGRIDSVRGGIRSVFESVPDAPVSQFVLDMKGGAKGLLVNSTNLCLSPHRAATSFTAQNGRARSFGVPLKSACGKGGARQRN